MSEYMLDCKLRNNLILQAIRDKGFLTVSAFCRVYDIERAIVDRFLNLKTRAVDQNGDWTLPARRLADVLQIEPDLLFTEQQRITELPTNRAEVAISEKLAIAMATDPYQFALQNDMANKVRKMLETLPSRERRVIEARFFEDESLEEVARKLDVTRERIRQIEAKALRKLRHPSRSDHLHGFLEADPQ